MNMKENYFGTFQWFIFLLANSIALPIVIGNMFALSETEITGLMQRTFLIVGISSFLQAKFGHRYPIVDGPAGSWVSIFVIYASIGVQQGHSMKETLQLLEGGLVIAGVLLFLLGVTKWVRHLLFLFTPIVTGIFLFILAMQLAGVFLNSMLVGSMANNQLDVLSICIALIVFCLIIFLSIKGKGWFRNYAVLIGILFGWIAFAITGRGTGKMSMSSELIQLPEVFAWGLPKFNSSIIVTAVLFTLLLISNTFAAIVATKGSMPDSLKNMEKDLNSGTWVGGISHFFSAIFSTIAVVPLPVTAGFIRLTKQYKIIPFLFACGILSVISLFPSIVSVLASLPLPVACAALLATLIGMVGIAVTSITKGGLDERKITIIGIALLLGTGSMFLTDDTLNGLPHFIQYLLKNGLLIGTLVAMALERFWKASVSNSN